MHCGSPRSATPTTFAIFSLIFFGQTQGLPLQNSQQISSKIKILKMKKIVNKLHHKMYCILQGRTAFAYIHNSRVAQECDPYNVCNNFFYNFSGRHRACPYKSHITHLTTHITHHSYKLQFVFFVL